MVKNMPSVLRWHHSNDANSIIEKLLLQC